MSQKTFEQLCEEAANQHRGAGTFYLRYDAYSFTQGTQFAIDNIDKHPRVAKLIEALEHYSRNGEHDASCDFEKRDHACDCAISTALDALAEWNKGKAE